MPAPPLARTLKDVFNTADPTRPLQSGDRRYVDCTAVRGNEDVISQMFNIISWTEKPTTAQLFTGHRGCGKSTELFRLRKRLEDAGYAVIYFEADEIIDVEDIGYSDVLVAIAQQVYLGLRELAVELPDELLNDVFAWFAEIIFEQKNVKEFQGALQAEFGFGLPQVLTPLAQLMAKITGQLRTGVESRKEIRRKLDPQIAHLIDRINLLIQTGIAALRMRGKVGLVIMVDNLDRIPFRKLDEIRNNHDALYIEHGEQLRALRCHVIYTVPIAILYSARARILTGIFPDCLTLPMIAERAIGRLTSEYSRSIPEEHFQLLADLYVVKRCKNDDDHRLMLHNLSVLEYMNGLEPWHDVHPSVQRLAKFQEARGHA